MAAAVVVVLVTVAAMALVMVIALTCMVMYAVACRGMSWAKHLWLIWEMVFRLHNTKACSWHSLCMWDMIWLPCVCETWSGQEKQCHVKLVQHKGHTHTHTINIMIQCLCWWGGFWHACLRALLAQSLPISIANLNHKHLFTTIQTIGSSPKAHSARRGVRSSERGEVILRGVGTPR